MLPIYLKDRDFTPPDDPIYYLLTKDGLFLVKRTPFFEAAVPARASPGWSRGAEVRLTAPPLPADLLLQAVAFFRAVYSRYKSEAVALLAWREAGRTYELVIPHQTVGGGHCDYEVRDFPGRPHPPGHHPQPRRDRGLPFGRDDADERHEDGFHLTVGNIDGDLTLACSVVVQGSGLYPPGKPLLPLPHPLGPAPPEEDWADVVDRRSPPSPAHRIRDVRRSSQLFSFNFSLGSPINMKRSGSTDFPRQGKIFVFT